MTVDGAPGLRELYPSIEPYRVTRFPVTDGHELYLEEVGNPQGKPVVYLHGGPGGSTNADHRRFFDPDTYRIVLFHQRGSGQSTPHASTSDNTTWRLVADIELIRESLGIDRWQVFGGSWGSTLALAYTISYPDRVTELVLRGIFLLRKAEIDWYYQEGASFIFPDEWECYLEPIPAAERGDLLSAFSRRLQSNDESIQLEAARAWSLWERNTSRLIPEPEPQSEDSLLALARIENHYFINKGFFESDGWLLSQVDRIRHVPAVIVQGRYDVVCPMRSAWDLHRAWPEAEFIVAPDAGHAAMEPGTRTALLNATDKFRS